MNTLTKIVLFLKVEHHYIEHHYTEHFGYNDNTCINHFTGTMDTIYVDTYFNKYPSSCQFKLNEKSIFYVKWKLNIYRYINFVQIFILILDTCGRLENNLYGASVEANLPTDFSSSKII